MKPKNKKILALLCLPVLVMTMILPLCSFVTIKDNQLYNVFDPFVTTDVGYSYHRSTSTLDEMYYGTIPNFNRCLMPSMIYDITSDEYIEIYASDYLMVGNTSINYDSFGSGGSQVLPDSTVVLSATAETGALFTGRIVNRGVIIPESIQNLWYEFIPSDGVQRDYYFYSGTINYIVLNNATNSFETIHIDVSNDERNSIENGEYGRLYMTTIFDSIFDRYISDTLDSNNKSFVCIDYMDITYYQATIDGTGTFDLYNEYGKVRVADKLAYEESIPSFEISRFNEFLSLVGVNKFDEGYLSGYNKGVQDGAGVFESLGDFLTTSVGAFFNFEFWDGFNLGTVMSIFVGAMLLVAFLRLFSGG